jgi:peroxiredoxin
MKKIALLLSLAAMAVGCKNLADNEFEINGTVDPLWEGRTVVLEKQSMFGFKALDTVKVKNAEFTFKDTVTEPGIYFLRVEQHLNEPITVIVEPGSIDILVRRDSINKSRPGGTYNNDKFTEFSDVFGKGLKKVQRYEANNQAKFTKAMQANDTKTATELRDGRQKLMDSWSKDMVNFVKDNPKAYVGLLAISQMQQMQLKDQDELKKLYLGLDKSVREGKDGRQLGIYLGAVATGEPKQAPAAAPAAGVKVGDVAPSFSAKNPEGKEISLKESLGPKVTIIDFWASWCPPCRKENPNMVALYKKFHDKGLNIIGVSLDKTADKWKEAIQKDGLPWAQVSNLMYWDEPIAKQYGVEQIPAPFVLDAAGKIVARDIYGDELEKKVAELVK